MDEFDKCAKTSNSDIKTAGEKGGLVPSFAHGMAQGNTMKAALQDVITAVSYTHLTLPTIYSV